MAGTDQTLRVPHEKPPQIRRAGPADAHDVGDLTERVYRAGGWAGEEYARVLADGRTRIENAIVFVAECAGAVVGTVTFALPATPFVDVAGPDEAEVRMLAVAAEARGRGVADALMDACERQARAAGLRGVVLSTEPDMHAAHRLYGRRGYARQPHRDWSIRRTSLLVFRKALTPG